MKRLQPYYDKRAQNYSLNWAVALTVIFAFYSCIGLILLLEHLRIRDNFYIFVGSFNFLLGGLGVFHGTQFIHAVVRRLIAESHPALTTEN